MSVSLQTVEAARAEAERIKRIGEAEAYSVEAVGKAEAESMKLKAQAYKQYGEAAIMSMVLESLPQVDQFSSHFPLSFVFSCHSPFFYAPDYSYASFFLVLIHCCPLLLFEYFSHPLLFSVIFILSCFMFYTYSVTCSVDSPVILSHLVFPSSSVSQFITFHVNFSYLVHCCLCSLHSLMSYVPHNCLRLLFSILIAVHMSRLMQ